MTEGQQMIQSALDQIEEGNFIEALAEADGAYCYFLETSKEERPEEGVIDALAVRVSALRHLYEATDVSEYALRALREAEYMVDYQKRTLSDEKKALAQYRLGTAYMINGDFGSAERAFDKALKNFQGWKPEHFDWQVHLGEATLMNGDKEPGLELMREAVKILTNFRKDEQDNRKQMLLDTWLTGAHIKLAGILIGTDEDDEGEQHMQAAQAIFDAYPPEDLKINRRRLRDLKSSL